MCLHEMEIMYSRSDAHIEHCKRCKKDFVYPIDYKGDFDQVKFVEDHQRDYIQPSNPLFEQEYGKDRYVAKEA